MARMMKMVYSTSGGYPVCRRLNPGQPTASAIRSPMSASTLRQ